MAGDSRVFLRLVARRAGLGAGQLVILLVLVFVLSLLLPGDAADIQNNTILSEAQQQTARQLLGLDISPVTRFLDWIGRAVRGDLGTSYASGEQVGAVIAGPFLITGLLAGVALILLVPIAVTAGFAAGTRPGSARDRWITSISIGFDSIPDFVLAVLLVTFLSIRLDLLPATFLGVDPDTLLDRPEYLVLPVLVTVARVAAPLVRLVRAGVVDVLDRPYIAQARRAGVGRVSLLVRHIAPNALAPAMQELGRTGDGLLSGVLIVEAVFAVPGIASELIGALANRDDPVILAIVAVTGTIAVVVNTVIDIAGYRMNPHAAAEQWR
ncbi:ABC transporter permease [Nocardia jinanensis]|uniref:Peptide ABC transporter permease n=1 Tax=Nocardia jinanensis TaxID=382504 RepID=A0A917VKX3_9NOCA|nr:ABC transporter permease [Nocardia jinanensis]GGK91984.1 peptide ABC transporter permease [Nocardia jinanensis]